MTKDIPVLLSDPPQLREGPLISTLQSDTKGGVNRILGIERGVNLTANILFTRHSKSPYLNYSEIFASDDPSGPFDASKQTHTDLTPSGVELARIKAGELFDVLSLDDELLFVTSNEARAVSTANIYAEVARKKGFTVIKDRGNRHPINGVIKDSGVIIINKLGLNFESPLLHSVFNPVGSPVVNSINLVALTPELKEKYDKARKIITEDDKGTFGENFFHHGTAIKKIFPEIQTSQDMYETQIGGLARMARKMNKNNSRKLVNKPVKILAFGHENYMSHALNEQTGNPSIGNCETVSINI